MAGRLAWMMGIAVGTPFLCLALIANALIPCAHQAACKGKRGWLMAGLALLLTVAAGLLARRWVKAALDKAALDKAGLDRAGLDRAGGDA